MLREISLFIILFLSGCLSPAVAESPEASSKVCLGDKCVSVEIADSENERERGLMFRTELPPNRGMLFVFEEENAHTFWMKNTLIPLDAIWVNAEKKIVDIQTMLPCEKDPCVIYAPRGNALYVLEVNAGVVEKNNIAIGDAVQLSEFGA